MRREWIAALVVASCITLLFLLSIERVIQGLFVSSLATLGVNISILSLPLVLTGFLYPAGLHRIWPHRSWMLTIALAVSLLLTIAGLKPSLSIAVGCGALAMLALTPLFMHFVAYYPQQIILGLACGTSITMAARVLNGTAPLAATQLGLSIIWTVIAVTAIGWRFMPIPAPTGEWAIGRGALAALFLFLFYQYQLLGSPSALSTLHVPGDVAFMRWIGLGAQVGLLLGGIYIVSRLADIDRKHAMRFYLIYILTTAWVLAGFLPQVTPLWVMASQSCALIITAACFQSRTTMSIRKAGTWAGTFQLLFLVFAVLNVFASRWSFLPALLTPMLRDKELLYLMLSYGMLPALLLLNLPRRAS